MNNNILRLMLVMLITGCTASVGGRLTDRVGDVESSNSGIESIFQGQAVCFNSWGSALDEWVEFGGGIKATLKETRKQIQNDSRSRFAKFVRRVWRSQRLPIEAEFGYWPIQTDVHDATTNLLTDSLDGGIPAGCRTLVWLPKLLWQISRGLKPKDAPAELAWEPGSGGDWMLFWLLVRMDEPVP